MRSKSASPFAVVLWLNEPLAVISSCRADLLLRPNQKCCSNTWFGKDKSRPGSVRIENLAQTAPIVFFSCWRKLRISCHRKAIRDIGKNARQNLFLNSSQSPFTLPMLQAYHYFALSLREKGNNFHRSVSCVMPEIVKHAQSCSNTHRWWLGFS